MLDYQLFLRSKKPRAQAVGVPCESSRLPARLFDYQQHCVEFALAQGRAGIFLDTGLGKTAIELAFADQAALATNGKALILAPLAVGWQVVREAKACGVEARQIREQSEAGAGVNVCNYDRLDRINADEFGCIVLDEASILKSFTGKTTRALIEAFAGHRFRMTATATPAPNDHMELGQQSEFLGVMDSNEMLMRWFVADQTQMGRYRLKGHGERDFWEWMASWSRMAENPSDMGFPGERFILPKLDIIYHRAEADVRPAEGALFDSIVSATQIHDVKRQTAEARAALAAAIIARSADAAVIWCDTDYEADAIRAVVPEAVEVRGAHPAERKEETLAAFADGQVRILLTKPSVAGYGLNWQHCHSMIFAGRTFSYEAWYQAVRRCWRFGQTQPVQAHVIVAQGEDQIAEVISRKSDDHIRMKRAMCDAMRRAIGKERASINDYRPTHQGRLPEWLH